MPESTSEYALEGTALHELMYTALTGKNPERGKPAIAHLKDTAYVVTHDIMEDKFWPVLDAMHALMDKHDIGEYDVELTTNHKKTSGPEISGTLDFAGCSKDFKTLLVADYKFGSGVRVSPEENYQLAFYTTGLLDNEDPWMERIEKIVFAILQPWRDEDVVQEWKTTVSWLNVYRALERKAYHAIKDSEDIALKPGKWCQFCRARPTCSAHNQAIGEFDKQTPALPNGLTKTELARLLDIGERAHDQYKVLLRYATEQAERGVDLPGYKLIESLGHRRFKQYSEARKRAVAAVGDEAMTAPELKSPAQLEKAFKRQGQDFGPMTALIERPSRGVRLVRDSHPAESVQTKPIDVPEDVKGLIKS